MGKDLFYYYQNELAYLREQGTAFAKAYPKIAGKLRLGMGHIEDPFVGRLIESFAFLTARVQHKVDSQFDLISQSIINQLNPNFLLPVPALTTVAISLNKEAETKLTIAKGETLTTKTGSGKKCKFTTCYGVDIYPITITNIKYRGDKTNKASLSFAVTTLPKVHSLKSLAMDKIRLYINLPTEMANLLYQQLFTNCIKIQLSYANDPYKKVDIALTKLSAVGFFQDEQLLPGYQHGQSASMSLVEYFTYPAKYLYIDLLDLQQYFIEDDLKQVQINFIFDSHFAILESMVNDNSIIHGCTPIINIFKQEALTIKLDHKKSEYQIIPAGDYTIAEIEVYQLLNMTHICAHKEVECRPYFGLKYADNSENNYLYWHQERKACDQLGSHHVPGTELFVGFSFDEEVANKINASIIVPEILCTNRDLATQLLIDGNNATFIFEDAKIASLVNVTCIQAITPPIYRDLSTLACNDLIALITQSQQGLYQQSNALAVLKSKLFLSCYNRKQDTELINQALLKVTTKQTLKNHPAKLKNSICSGATLTVTVDEAYFSDNSLYLFGCVLQFYLTQSCSVNSFIELVINNKCQEECFRWPISLGLKQAI